MKRETVFVRALFVAVALLSGANARGVDSTNSFASLATEWEGHATNAIAFWLMVIRPDMAGAIGTTDIRFPLQVWNISKITQQGEQLTFEVLPAHPNVPKLRFKGVVRRGWATEWLELSTFDENGGLVQKLVFRKSSDVKKIRDRLTSAWGRSTSDVEGARQ